MTLRVKFGLMLVLLGLTVLAALTATVWSLTILERGLATPLTAIDEVLNGLRQTRQQVQRQIVVLDAAQPQAENAQRYQDGIELIRRTLSRLEASTGYQSRVGASTARYLVELIERADEGGTSWFAAGRTEARSQAREDLTTLTSLLDRLEGRVIEDTTLAVQYGRLVRSRLRIVLGVTLLTVVLAGILGMRLVRRWVIRPVAVLRAASERIGHGDFQSRIEVTGSDELSQLSTDVNTMAQTIEQMQEERIQRERLAAIGEMVRRVTHNLRNPLAGIRSLAELSRGELEPGTDLYAHQDRIIRTVDRFEQWLNELLSATRPISVIARPTRVGPWLESIVESHRAVAASKSVRLSLDTSQAPDHACFDPRHVEQAVVAVISNAIQASPYSSRVAIGARLAADDGQWEIRIADHGPGVPPQIREQIFRPYFTTKRDGTGIGLAVAKQIIEQHGGRIWLESTPNGPDSSDNGTGTEFVMRLPLDSEGALPHNREPGSRP